MADVNLDRFIYYVNKYLGKKVSLIYFYDDMLNIFEHDEVGRSKEFEIFVISELSFSDKGEIFFKKDGEFLNFSFWENMIFEG